MPTRFFRVSPPRSGIASNGNIARVKIYIHMHITTMRIVIILVEVDTLSTDTTINQQREEHEFSQLFPYAECVSRSRTEAVWIFKFFVLFYFLIFIYSHSPRARAFRHVHNDTFARNSDVYTLDSTIKGRGSWSWNCKQDISSIDQTSHSPPTPPLILQ